ncbi:MAG: pyridoxal-phosphate-dependent aminotransferase family protein [Candidatus Limnocylindrales bacterium]
MNRFETNLRIPGPTSLPSAVREAGARQMINHRGPEFAAMLERVSSGLKGFYGTTNDIVLLTCAGSGGLEAAIVNTLSPGDRVLGVSIGAFGDRFAKIARVYGADVTKLDIEWGHAAEPDDLRRALEADGGYRAILLTLNETSTGVMNPIRELAAVARELAPDALVLMDGVSALGAVPFEQDAWGIDIAVSGSQKSWMAAPGMAFLGVSERAWEAGTTARMPRFYLDIAEHRTAAATGQTPFTPALTVLFQLDVAMGLMLAEGADAIYARHAACAAATQAGLAALGFALFAEPARASETVTCAWLPEDLDWKAFNTEMKKRKLVLAGGQGKLTGKVFRIGHLGTVTLDEIVACIGVIEESLLVLGRDITPGAGVAAAQRAGLERIGLATGVGAGA